MKEKFNIGLDVKIPNEKCNDKHCPFHSNQNIHGRIFEGEIVSKDTHRTAVIRWNREFYVRKYERYEKRKSKLKVHNPPCINAKIGDLVMVAETRPISKTKKFIIIQNESNKS